MNARHLVLITAAATLLTIAPSPVEAGGSFGIHVSNHGFGLSFGTSNWGIWGSSWDSGHFSVGFTSALDGYGEWIWIDGLGRVWRPWVATSWQPYSHGRWVWTSHGWTWVAYEPWGWVPHHYGNWARTTFGWVWTPGYTYHAGNVVWIGSGSYIGWYPCAPRGWSHAHRGFHRGWRDGYRWGRHDGYHQGYRDGWLDARYATWVPRHHVTSENIVHHAVTHTVATRSVARSRITAMAVPPSKREVERMVGRSVPEARVVERKAKVDGREIRVVRPEGQKESVRRHGSETVTRALAPSARDRATTTPSRRSTETSRSRSSTVVRPEVKGSPGTTPRSRVEAPSAIRQQRSSSTTSPAARPSRGTVEGIRSTGSRSSASISKRSETRSSRTAPNSTPPVRTGPTSRSAAPQRPKVTTAPSRSRATEPQSSRRAEPTAAARSSNAGPPSKSRADRTRTSRSSKTSADVPRKPRKRR